MANDLAAAVWWARAGFLIGWIGRRRWWAGRRHVAFLVCLDGPTRLGKTRPRLDV